MKDAMTLMDRGGLQICLGPSRAIGGLAWSNLNRWDILEHLVPGQEANKAPQLCVVTCRELIVGAGAYAGFSSHSGMFCKDSSRPT